MDVLLLLDIYAAGVAPLAGVDGRSLSGAIRLRRLVDPIFVQNPKELDELLPKILCPDDVLLTLGAGNIGAIAAELPMRIASSIKAKENHANIG